MKQKGPQRDLEKQRFWQHQVRQWRRSGQSIREYCRENALSEPSFYAWRRELARRRQASAVTGRARGATRAHRGAGSRTGPAGVPTAFLPVRVVTPGTGEAGRGHPTAVEAAGGVEILLAQGRTLRVRTGFDRQTLADVLVVLEGRPC